MELLGGLLMLSGLTLVVHGVDVYLKRRGWK